MRSYTTAKKKFTDPKTGEVRSYANDPVLCTSPADSRQSAAEYASCIEYGEQVIVAGEPGKMYFPEEELYQWISPQQLDQFKKMYPDCVEISYNSALGYVYSQIGELYDIASILAGDTNDGTSKIMRWILTVLTAYNITSPSARHSETLRDNYEMVVKKVTEMKNGATTLHDAPIKDPECVGYGSKRIEKQNARINGTISYPEAAALQPLPPYWGAECKVEVHSQPVLRRVHSELVAK